jgi:hypothetical protein
MFAWRLRLRWLDKPMPEAPQAFFADWPSFTGDALIIFRSARRSRAGHLPQMTQSSSEIGLQSELADIVLSLLVNQPN